MMESEQIVSVEFLKSEPPDEEEEEEIVVNPLISSILMRENMPTISNALRKKPNDLSTSTKVFQLGKTFKSFTEVAQAIQSYESKNKVNLNQKYFRRIAANPKPSNKEDYSLTVEERKRFVYRWVDFCCTYFDTLPVPSRSDLDGDGSLPSIGFTMKECPMRIRFQTRFKEKDLIVSILRENHDHSHPNDGSSHIPNKSSIPETGDNASSVGNNLVTKQNLRPPPSLAPLPSNPLSRVKSLSSPSPLSARRSSAGQTHSLLRIPRPPPLRKGPQLGHTQLSDQDSPGQSRVPIVNDGKSDDLSKVIIKNIFNYLIRTKANRYDAKNPLAFKSTNPDLIKLTSEIAGVDQKMVREIVISRPTPRRDLHEEVNYHTSPRNNDEGPCIAESRHSSSCDMNRFTKRSQTPQREAFHKPKRCRIINNNDSIGSDWTTHISFNAESSAAYQKLANLPLDISIKREINSYTSEDDDYTIEFADSEHDPDNYYVADDASGR